MQFLIICSNPWGLRCKETACSVGDLGLIPGLGRSPRERNELLPPVFLPGEFHGQRSLASYTPWGHKGSDTSERLIHTQQCHKFHRFYTFSMISLYIFKMNQNN